MALKDTLSLRELAARFGTNATSLLKALARRGITRKSAPTGPRKYRKPIVTEDAPTELMAPAAKAGRGRSGTPGAESPIETFATYVGTMPDSAVARMAGVTVSAVTKWRLRRRIPAATSGRRPAVAESKAGSGAVPTGQSEQAPVKPQAPRRSAGSSAWRVTLDSGVVGYVLASTMHEAAVAALGAGTVTAIELAGDALWFGRHAPQDPPAS